MSGPPSIRRGGEAPAGSPRWRVLDAERYLVSLELFGMRFGLDRMRRLMTALGLPQQRFGSIHVVGTNGKSSTVRMIAAILERHGLRTGAYLSPHLVSFTERIRVAERDIDEQAFADAVARAAQAGELVNRTLADDDRITAFEALTAAAYSELAARGVDVAVIEAGLGGRFDATNVIDSRVQLLTNVGLEHTRWLGPTIADIAGEKLAVVRRGATLVLGAGLEPDADAEARRVAATLDARIVRAPADPGTAGDVLLARGEFQRRNFALAQAAAEAYLRALDPGFAGLDAAAVRAAAAATAVPGRLELVADDPPTIYDVAHNPDGVAALVESLPRLLAGRPLTAVVSILEDKDAAAMLSILLGRCARVILTANSNPRALSPATLESLARQLQRDAPAPAELLVEPDPRRALARARERAAAPKKGESGGVVLATGSIYLIADLLRAPGTEGGSTL